MTLLIQQNQPGSNIPDDNRLTSEGWVTTDLNHGSFRPENGRPSESETSLAHNLPLATKRAEQLMDALEEDLSIAVSVSYMRIETSTLFHVLLLISREDFLSPGIQTARLIAEKIARISGTYDIRFSFAIESENMMGNGIKFNGFRLMHIR